MTEAVLTAVQKNIEEEIRNRRIARIRERALALFRAGFYSAEEGKLIMKWTKSELLVECEMILANAELLISESTQ
jgi:5'-deoxynucleotidase YfbR-like HD superfamily hydrolase